jgi:hypothetical protein
MNGGNGDVCVCVCVCVCGWVGVSPSSPKSPSHWGLSGRGSSEGHAKPPPAGSGGGRGNGQAAGIGNLGVQPAAARGGRAQTRVLVLGAHLMHRDIPIDAHVGFPTSSRVVISAASHASSRNFELRRRRRGASGECERRARLRGAVSAGSSSSWHSNRVRTARLA